MRMRASVSRPALFAAVALLSACRGPAGYAAPGIPAFAHGATSGGKIQHVVIIVQENRSFNNLFMGYPGAKTTTFGYNATGQKIALKPVSLATTWDPQHDARGFILACNGTGKIPGTDCKMNGFDSESCGPEACPGKNAPYAYVPRDEVQPYFDMAAQYVLADHMFASDFDTSSFESHQYIIAGQNPKSTVDYPDGDWGCSGVKGDGIDVLKSGRNFSNLDKIFPCWNVTTLADELDAAGLTWSYYAVKVSGSNKAQPASKSGRGSGIWSAYQAIKHIYYGKDWNSDVISPPSQFITDIGNGDLRTVTWITPTYANSDHGGSGSKTGPSWVTSLVNAIGESPFWNSTAIFIFWDDSGGWFDPEPPAYLPQDNGDSFGMRLPLLIVSPYAKKGYVAHANYEHGTMLKFIEDEFGLAAMSYSDKRANAPDEAFDFSQPPRKFVPIKAQYDRRFFLAQPLDNRIPDAQ
jgi:phospholipase C